MKIMDVNGSPRKGQSYLPVAITFGTTAYHFLIRLGIGFIFNRVMHNRADYTAI